MATDTDVKQGFGCMGITAFYGDPMPDDKGVELLEQVYALGVRHFDTAEIYRTGNPFDTSDDPSVKYNETVVGKFAKKIGRDKVFIATKFHPGKWGAGSVENVNKAFAASLARLDTDYVDLYYMHRLPKNGDVVGFMNATKALVEQGKIRAVGLSEATAAKIREANAIAPVSYIQQEWSLLTRNLEESIVPTCAELGIKIVAYSPLARNLLSGLVTETPSDWRGSLPRYSPENLAKNAKLVAQIAAMAESKGCTAAQLSLAWLLTKAKALGVTVIPIPGTTKIKHATDNVAAERVELTAEDLTHLEAIGAQVAGERAGEQYRGAAFEGHE